MPSDDWCWEAATGGGSELEMPGLVAVPSHHVPLLLLLSCMPLPGLPCHASPICRLLHSGS